MSYENWKDKAQGFQTMDVRHIQGSFFEGLRKRAEALEVGEGLHIIQTFEPHPLYAVMEEMLRSGYTIGGEQSGRQNGILWVHGYVLSAAFCAAVPVHYRKADEIHFGNGAPVFLHCDFQADVGFGKQLHQEKIKGAYLFTKKRLSTLYLVMEITVSNRQEIRFKK